MAKPRTYRQSLKELLSDRQLVGESQEIVLPGKKQGFPEFETTKFKSGQHPRSTTLKGPLMPTSEARIRANQQNAAKSSGPRTAEGKEKSRQNALKHGLTGAGVVLLEADAAELKRRTETFSEELCPIGEVGDRLVARVALHSLRMDRAVDQQNTSLAVRLRQVEADFVAPEGVDEAEAKKMLEEQLRIARFDPCKEACLARSYEAASERAFYRGLKQLRQMEIQAEELIKADDAMNHQNEMNQAMASFFQKQAQFRQEDEEFDAMYESMKMDLPPRPANSPQIPASARLVDVPLTIGRTR